MTFLWTPNLKWLILLYGKNVFKADSFAIFVNFSHFHELFSNIDQEKDPKLYKIFFFNNVKGFLNPFLSFGFLMFSGDQKGTLERNG